MLKQLSPVPKTVVLLYADDAFDVSVAKGGLMARPLLLMIDEMSLGLAPVVVEQLMAVLEEIRKQDVTVLLVEQDIHLALSLADRGYVMDTGSIARSGAAKDLIDDPAVREAYLGLA